MGNNNQEKKQSKYIKRKDLNTKKRIVLSPRRTLQRIWLEKKHLQANSIINASQIGSCTLYLHYSNR
jgi:hypothetical protein